MGCHGYCTVIQISLSIIHYATERRKKDIINLMCCADDSASFRVGRAASNSNPGQIRRSVSERRATKVLLKVTLTL